MTRPPSDSAATPEQPQPQPTDTSASSAPAETEAARRWIREPGDAPDRATMGGKAAALAALGDAGLPVPRWRAVSPTAFTDSLVPGDDPDARITASSPVAAAIETAVHALLASDPAGDGWLAIRSSAADEDGGMYSFAGQLESYLFVPPEQAVARVEDVWASATSERVRAYRREHGLDPVPTPPAVLIQPMMHPDVAGVAFSADPVSGRRGLAVVSATYGLGTAIVGGEQDGDSFVVDADGRIVSQQIATKDVAHRLAAGGGVAEQPVAAEDRQRASLSPAQVAAVADLVRAAEQHAGAPQDIEWAIEGDRLVLLQSRPITSLAALADPDGAVVVWDNSNIVESYGGVTTPLTYTFARTVYEAVYRQFCRMLAVPEERIAAHSSTFRCMIGLVRGRVYYNLSNWYRALALLPGYALNRGFMEQMMGVKEPLSPALADALAASAAPQLDALTWRQRWRARAEVARSVVALVSAHRRLGRDVPAFHRRLDMALVEPAVPLHVMRADQLVAHYRDLEQRLLLHWDTPLVNDFFAMIHFGLLGRLCARWLGDDDGTLHNDLVSGGGDMVSAEPARRLETMAALARPYPELVSAFAGGTRRDAEQALAAVPPLRDEVAAYLNRFGDRCLEELKLETETLVDDPLALYRAIGRLAAAAPRKRGPDAGESPRAVAEERMRATLGGVGPRAWIFAWVLAQARARVRDRENLRFERTRLFGRVRRIFVELGRRYAAVGLLDSPRGVFYLELDELLGAVDATTSSDALSALAAVRRETFASYAASAAPDDRFLTHGLALAGHSYRGDSAAATAPALEGGPTDGDTRAGTGCYPGTVTGVARVVRDPRDAELHPGEILVAERTDPGWVMLFPAAAALLVERGSLLSHSAIVARELALPAIVGVPGLTSWLRSGDVVTMDGRTGRVTRLHTAGDEEGR